MVILSSCSQKELEDLRIENLHLKQEITKLKETADYHYRQGVDLLSAQNYDGAKEEFETVIKKYPESNLITNAKQQLTKVNEILAKIEAQRKAEERRLEAQRQAEERRRKEEEKYRPKSPEEANREWLNFRNNESQYKGTVTTWKLKCNSMGYGGALGSIKFFYCNLNDKYDREVTFSSTMNDTLFEQCVEIHENDWLIVTGKFKYVKDDGGISIEAIRIKNLGTQ